MSDGFGRNGEPFESIPFWEDVWDVDEDGRQVWTPYIVTTRILPGYPGPVRYAEWPGVFSQGRQLAPMPGIGWIRPEDRQAAEDERWLQLPDGDLPALGEGK